MHQLSLKQFVLLAGLAAIVGTWHARAENIRFIDSPTLVDSMGPEFFCDTFAFEDDVLSITTQGATFDSGAYQIVATTSLTAHVDPASGGPNLVSIAPVSLETGYFSMRGSSAALGITGESILLGNVRGIERTVTGSPSGFSVWIEITYMHPALVAEIGPASTIRYLTSHEQWFFTQPWEDEIAPVANSCVQTNGNALIRLYSEPLPSPNPVTLQIEAPADAISTTCPFVEAIDQTINLQFTYDSNTRDLDPDPNVGRYMSCDDTYGASSGAIVTTGDFSYKVPCVMIVVENDSANGSPGSEPADLYSVSIMGDSALRGLIVRLEDVTGAAFSDDSLPQGALPITPPGGTGGFVAYDLAPISLQLSNVCEITSNILRPAFTQLGDVDSDGLTGAQDNCLLRANARQRDSDGDGYGNACDADFNNDDIVNIVDLGIFRTRFFTTGNEHADLNSDGLVNVVDLGRLRQLFFQPPGPSGLHQ